MGRDYPCVPMGSNCILRGAFLVTLAARPATVIRRLTYGQANDVLRAFNNGKISFEGRIWR
jgi:hypothetical protein